MVARILKIPVRVSEEKDGSETRKKTQNCCLNVEVCMHTTGLTPGSSYLIAKW